MNPILSDPHTWSSAVPSTSTVPCYSTSYKIADNRIFHNFLNSGDYPVLRGLKINFYFKRVRKIRRGLEELAADIEMIKLQRYERQLLKEVNSGLPDRVKGNKSPTQSRGRSRPMKMENKESLTDDSGNLLLDVILAGSMKKDH